MSATNLAPMNGTSPVKLTGRAFYESIGSPKIILAPMVDRSEFAWRLLSRSYMPQTQQKSLLAYSPMLHARLFKETAKFRDQHFQPTRQSLTTKDQSATSAWLDGNPSLDRPLFVQFCANNPSDLLEAAQYVAPFCDAVDLNLGCPQGIARAGHYGAFLQEDWETIYNLINKLHNELQIPITAKMRVLDTKEKTLEYAKMILSAGASILTVHGRRREQKGHNMGVADWKIIRYLRDNLPPETVLFANGNVLNFGDLQRCIEETGVDGVMSAEGNLSDPTVFAGPPSETQNREYWKGVDGKGGYRLDGVYRRYLDIIHKHVLDQDPPQRQPLYVPGDDWDEDRYQSKTSTESQPPPNKKRKRDAMASSSPNLKAMQGHSFQLLKPMLGLHTDIRDALAKVRVGDMVEFERILQMVENAVRAGLDEDAKTREVADIPEDTQTEQPSTFTSQTNGNTSILAPINPSESLSLSSSSTQPTENPSSEIISETPSSEETIRKYKRPWWICQPYIRPLPSEAIQKGSLTLSKKEKAKIGNKPQNQNEDRVGSEEGVVGVQRTDEREQVVTSGVKGLTEDRTEERRHREETELPKEALVCG